MYRLREIKKEDLKAINQWRNDPELISCLGAPFRYINLEVDFKWFENYMSNRNNCIRCAIVDEDYVEDILGLVSLTGIDYIHRCAALHIMIGNESCRGKGIGTFAVNAMLEHGFLNMNLHRIELGVLKNNKVAIGLYEKCGFVKEGAKRKAVYKNGSYQDLIMMAILDTDYNKAHKNKGEIM